MLDRETLSVVVSMVAQVTLLVMYTVWRINRHVPGLRCWMAAAATMSLSFLAIPLALGMGWSFSHALIVNHAATLIALMLLLQGCLRFRGHPAAEHWPKALCLLAPLAVLSSVLNHAHAVLRYQIHDAFSVLMLVLSAWVMCRHSRPEERLVHRVSGFFLWLMAAAMATRWVLAWLAPDDRSIQDHPFQGALYLILVLFIIGWTYSISLACYQQAQSRVLALAREDALTDLPNRRYFDETLDREVARWERNQQPFGLVMADLNGFKQVNDRLGHDAGDAVLIEVARRLREFARGGDFVARLGGDEFVILIHDLSSLSTGEQAVQRLRKTVNGPMRLASGASVDIEVSLGLAAWPHDATQPGDLVKVADLRMYAEKALLKAQRGLSRSPRQAS